MKNRIIGLILAATLAVGASSLVSCTLPDISIEQAKGESSLTSEEIQKQIDDAVNRAISDLEISREVNEYQITVTGDTTALDAVRPALLSVASVICKYVEETTTRNPFTGKETTETQDTAAAGAAVLYKLDKEAGDAYFITNYHVVFNAASNTKNHVSDDITLYLYGQELTDYAIPATYVGGSMNYDLAVLRVSNNAILRASEARAITIANSDLVCPLDLAIAIGNPKANGISATVGYVNVPSEYITMLGADDATQVEYRVLRVDTPVNNGNSGGGLFNDRGELIGIVNAKIIDTTVDNFGYAIPSNIVKNIADNILYYCEGGAYEHPQRALLGVTVEVKESRSVFDPETGRVTIAETIGVREVNAGSIAEGNLMAGDVIVSVTVGGVTKEITRLYQVIDHMLTARIGDTVSMQVLRDGTQVTVSMKVTEAARTEAK